MRKLVTATLAITAVPVLAQAAALRPDQQAFRALMQEIVETDTTVTHGSCTDLATKIAGHLKQSGYPDTDLTLFSTPENPKDGGLVAVHYHFRHAPDQRGLAVVDLFRIEHGYLVEHWDIIQPIPDPETFKNDNGMF